MQRATLAAGLVVVPSLFVAVHHFGGVGRHGAHESRSARAKVVVGAAAATDRMAPMRPDVRPRGADDSPAAPSTYGVEHDEGALADAPRPTSVGGEPRPESPAIERSSITPGEQVAHIDSVFQDQRYDASWAREAEATLESRLKGTGEGTALSSVRCRQSLCKAEVEYVDDDSYQHLVETVFRSSEFWEGAKLVMKSDSSERGRPMAVLFFARVGLDMPYAR